MAAAVQPPPLSSADTPIRTSWIVWPLVAHGALFVLIFLGAVVVVPKFEEIFRSFNQQLPFMTRLLLGASHVAQKVGLFALPAFIAGDVWLYASLRRRGRNVAAEAWWWAVTIIALGIVVAFVIGLFLPLVALMQSVSNSAAGG